jgi:hypothetical protein
MFESALRANLTITEMSMRKEIENSGEIGWLVCKKIQGGVLGHMGRLAEAFNELAPERNLHSKGREPELTSTLLTRLSRKGDQSAGWTFYKIG